MLMNTNMTDPKNTEQKQTDTNAEAVENTTAEQVDASSEKPLEGNQDVNLQAELDAAQAEVGKLKDAYLRAKAEEENVRRRAEKEVANSRKFAVEGFAKEMLNVYDSLKLAIAVELADDADESIKSVHEGVNITLKQLQAAMSKFAITEIQPEVGEKLDPNLHQAMSMIESAEVASGSVINVIQSGFQLHDRLLRPAMVVVAK
jgi:molecular chaperone GrpE